jgi:parallel beta-helix repeat protein
MRLKPFANFAIAVSVALSLVACSSTTTPDGGTDAGTDAGSGPCSCITGACIPFTAGVTTEAEIDAAFTTAKDGTTLAFGPGTFNLVNTLQLVTQNDITVIGAGIDVTILDFSNQADAGNSPDGISAQDLQGLTLYNLTVQNTAGNAFKVATAQNIIFEGVKATWSNQGQPADVDDGPYGIYPVTVENVLIENNQVSGASDTGIYIGQSTNVICRNNTTTANVAGIESENSYFVDIYGNDSHDNTAGILVFDLPSLQQQGGHDIHVHDNQMVNNNGSNFATNGDIVSIVPSGTGFFVMANHVVEVDGNTVTGNQTIGMAVISYFLAQEPFDDPSYYPYPYNIWIHDNTVSGNGASPSASTAMGQLLLAESPTFPGQHSPDLAWDGVYDPQWAADAGTLTLSDGGANPNPAELCFTNNGSTATFVNLNMCDVEIYGSDAGITCPGLNPPFDGGAGGIFEAPDGSTYPTNLAQIDNTNIAPFDCDAPTVGVVDAGVYFPDGGLCGS